MPYAIDKLKEELDVVRLNVKFWKSKIGLIDEAEVNFKNFIKFESELQKAIAHLQRCGTQPTIDNTGSLKLPDSLLDGWDSVWSVLNDYASCDCKKRFSGTDPNAVLGNIYHKLAIIYLRQQEYVRQLKASRPGASA